MARPPRIEIPGALYHVTSRGDRREPIFADNFDRNALLDVLADGLTRLDATVLAYCLMGNYYHLVVCTRQANLSRLMRHVNGVYTQRFNRRHGLVGHLFQGRFKSILVDHQSYLLEVCRYVDLNPVRAGLVAQPGDWPWSSFSAHTGRYAGPPWLDSQALWSALLAEPVSTPAQAMLGASRYVDLRPPSPVTRHPPRVWKGLTTVTLPKRCPWLKSSLYSTCAPPRWAASITMASQIDNWCCTDRDMAARTPSATLSITRQTA